MNSSGALVVAATYIEQCNFLYHYTATDTHTAWFSPLLSVGRAPLLTLRLLRPTPHKDEVFCAPNPAPERCAMAAPTIRRLVVARIMFLVGVLTSAPLQAPVVLLASIGGFTDTNSMCTRLDIIEPHAFSKCVHPPHP